MSQVPHGLFVTELLLPGHTVLNPVSTAGASTQILLGWACMDTAWMLASVMSPSSSPTQRETQTMPQSTEKPNLAMGGMQVTVLPKKPHHLVSLRIHLT